jgi:hypothetical protein
VPTTWPSRCEYTYERLVPKYDEELRDPSLRMGGKGHIDKSEHLGWETWVVVSCIGVLSCCLSE